MLGTSAPLNVILKEEKWCNLIHLDFELRLLRMLGTVEKRRFLLDRATEKQRKKSNVKKKKKKGRDQQLSPWGRRREMTLSCLPAQCPGSVCHGSDEISCACVCVWQGQRSPLITPGGGSDIQLPVHYDKQILNLLFPNLFWNRRQLGQAWPYSHQYKCLFPGLDKAPCLVVQGNRYSMWATQGGGRLQPRPLLLPLTFKRVQMTSTLFWISLYTYLSTSHIPKIYQEKFSTTKFICSPLC